MKIQPIYSLNAIDLIAMNHRCVILYNLLKIEISMTDRMLFHVPDFTRVCIKMCLHPVNNHPTLFSF